MIAFFSSRSRWLVLVVAFVSALFLGGCEPQDDGVQSTRKTDLRWATSAVGSSGHRALVQLAAFLNRHLPEHQITVLPMPGAIMGLRAYVGGEVDGYYGADLAMEEWSLRTGRFANAPNGGAREPVQSFWAYTMETGLAVAADQRDAITSWADLAGRPVFTGPAPWDTRAQIERMMAAAGVEHRYVETDLSLAASQLQNGRIAAIGIYTTGEKDLAPWIAEAERAVSLAVLNPSPAEQAAMEEAGLGLVAVDAAAFQTDVGTERMVFAPFYYGFHVGDLLSADALYKMLVLIEREAPVLAAADPLFSQLADGMPALQARAVALAAPHALIHPGLARYMRERGVWNAAWDERVARFD